MWLIELRFDQNTMTWSFLMKWPRLCKSVLMRRNPSGTWGVQASVSHPTGANSIFIPFCLCLCAAPQVERLIKERGWEFMWNERLGYVLTCPSNLGTGLRAGVHVKLPRLSKVHVYMWHEWQMPALPVGRGTGEKGQSRNDSLWPLRADRVCVTEKINLLWGRPQRWDVMEGEGKLCKDHSITETLLFLLTGPQVLQDPGEPEAAEAWHWWGGHCSRGWHLRHLQPGPPGSLRGNLLLSGLLSLSCPSFLAEMGQFPSADLTGSMAVFTPGGSGTVEMLTVNVHEMFGNCSCHGSGKTQPWASCTNICWGSPGGEAGVGISKIEREVGSTQWWSESSSTEHCMCLYTFSGQLVIFYCINWVKYHSDKIYISI